MKKRKLKIPIKIALISLLCLVGILLLLFFPIRYLKSSDYFKIKNSDYFAGQNIFKINLKKEAQRLSHMYPDYKRVTLQLLLPDEIIVDFILRQAVAKVALPDDFYVDEEGVLFRPIRQQEGDSPLPLIIGLAARISHPRSGVKYNEKPLQATLEFINNLSKESKLAEQLKIKEINLANVNDVFLFTTTGCKINLGGTGSLNKNLSILRRLISEINFDLTKMEYIDLRFKEPVVKYK